MKTLIIMLVIGAFAIAIAMEFIKLSGSKKPVVWNIIALLLSILVDVSIYFGVANELHIMILPFAVLITYILQYMLNQLGAKKLMIAIVNQYLTKHGYDINKEL